MTVLDVSNLTKIYGRPCGNCVAHTGPELGDNQCPICESVVACAEVDFELHDGEVLGIVGESGSGKSSLAEVLALDLDATAGDVRYDTADGNLLTADYRTRHELQNEHIGMVHQQVQDGLELDFSGGGNVAEKLLAADWRHFGEIRERVESLFQETEVPVSRMDDAT
ncbi:MAG: ATP-binding cassette domain-containing protein, partial [Halovenus sp.]